MVFVCARLCLDPSTGHKGCIWLYQLTLSVCVCVCECVCVRVCVCERARTSKRGMGQGLGVKWWSMCHSAQLKVCMMSAVDTSLD